ncbi:hypothetical protein V3C99_004747 [Haemonchus contortus]
MDVVYDVVESIHIFIPLVAIVFVCSVLYFYNRKDAEAHSHQKGRHTISATETKKEK